MPQYIRGESGISGNAAPAVMAAGPGPAAQEAPSVGSAATAGRAAEPVAAVPAALACRVSRWRIR